MKMLALIFGIIGSTIGIIISLTIIGSGNGHIASGSRELGNALVVFGVSAFLLFFLSLIISWLSSYMQISSGLIMVICGISSLIVEYQGFLGPGIFLILGGFLIINDSIARKKPKHNFLTKINQRD